MSAPTGYTSSVEDYAEAGFIYVYAGCRGRDSGAPAGVTDLKAAVRYIRYISELIPGNTDSIFTFGMSGGGAQSALMGATGNSSLYDPYLEAIGAVMDESDAVAGSMCWCPITNLDAADEAYEWNMGSTRSGLSDEEQTISDSLANAYAAYINELGLTLEDGTVLSLEESEDGVYQAGSYYEYLKSVIEGSLNNFLSDTEFPYTAASSSGMGNSYKMMRGDKGDRGTDGKPDGEMPDGEKPDDLADGELPEGIADGELPSNMGEKPEDLPEGETTVSGDGVSSAWEPEDSSEKTEADFYAEDGVQRTETASSIDGADGVSSGTYETPQDYIDSLNSDTEWITYDPETNTVTITDVASFVQHCKNASKGLGAFDDMSASQAENTLFGYADGSGAHFDSVLAEILEGTDYESAYAEDLAKTDSAGNTVETRVNMYNPMYYLCDYYEGSGSSDVAEFWRIRTGINQSDTALCTEVNLALALENYGASVDFETVWGQGHTEAERTGSSAENFITWVNECLNQ